MRRPSKYGNRRVTVDGINFASAKEAKRYGELKLRERAGEIAHLKTQARFPLHVEGQLVCTYVADFVYDLTGKPASTSWMVVEDVKGFRTDVYKIKRKLMKAVHNIDVVEV